MRNLVRRYVTVEQRKAESQGVTEDDVNEIKQDISAFRCEIVEILKGSGMNTNIVSGQAGGMLVSNICFLLRFMCGKCVVCVCYIYIHSNWQYLERCFFVCHQCAYVIKIRRTFLRCLYVCVFYSMKMFGFLCIYHTILHRYAPHTHTQAHAATVDTTIWSNGFIVSKWN